ncbi:two-component system response regulator [Candidatus Latescibacterota bacterium]
MKQQKKSILSIDDNEMMLELLEGILFNSEFKLYTSSDPNNGIRLAKKIKPDIILVDIMMPKMNGFMVSKVLKLNPETKNIPILFITSLNTKEDLLKAINSGGIDYIVKPFNSSDLLTRIRKILDHE